MRRILAGTTAFAAMTGTLLVLPVYAAPAPEPEPVETSIDTVELGSVTAPAPEADVAPADDVQPDVVGTVAEDAPAGTEPVAAEDPVLTLTSTDVDEFSAVGVTWAADDDVTDVRVRLRAQDGDGQWGDWTDLSADDVEQTPSAGSDVDGVRAGTPPYWTGPATGVEVQLTGAGEEQPRDVQLELIDPGDSPADAAPGAPAAQDQANAASAMPPVHSRSQWGADESIRTGSPQYAPTIKAATLHHTDNSNTYTAEQVPALMRSMYAYHTQSRGWGDIGYNVVVDRFGRLWEGRYGGLSSTVVGAHAGGFNSGTFGVSLLGNYARTDTPAVVLESAAAVIAWKFDLYGVDPRGTARLTSGGGGTAKYAAGTVVTLPTVFAHRDVGSTTCAGDYAYARMGQLRDMVAARVGSAPGGSPVGNLESLTVEGATLSLSGWTFDPDYPPGGLQVAVDVDGRRTTFTADRPRPDIAAAFPQAGPNHGFAGRLTLSRGQHRICVQFLNAPATGRDLWAKCLVTTVTVDPATTTNPVGNLESVEADGKTIRLRGWTVDPDARTASLDAHVYLDGGYVGAVAANADRPDVGAAFPGAGSRHGFTSYFTSPAPGPHEVCVYAINRNAGTTNPELGCRTVTSPQAPWLPAGSLDSVAVAVDGRSATVSGWTLDPDAPTRALSVHVYVDGRYAAAGPADRSRPDVGQAFPAAGPAHGYSLRVPLVPGEQRVCAYAINVDKGSTNPLLGCRVVSVAAAAWNPVGSLDEVTGSGGSVRVRGWAVDPDRADRPVDLHVYVDGRWAGTLTASADRPDVAAAFPGAGPAHGYTATLPVGAGTREVCVFAINVGHGSTNPLLGCRSVQA